MSQPILATIGQFRGEFAAIGAAFLWAIATVLYSRIGRVIPPLELNLVKGCLAIGLILATLGFSGELLVVPDLGPIVLLGLSGIIGIGLGDTAYLEALSDLGPRRTLLMETLAPPLAGVIAHVFLAERLGFIAWTGIVVTLAGVAWVISERTDPASPPVNLRRGIIMGSLAALGQAVGAVLSRFALTATAISPLASSLVRLAGGVLIVIAWLALKRQPVGRWIRRDRLPAILFPVLFAPFIGTFLGIWLQQVSLKFTDAGVAQTLLTTSPLFVLPWAAAAGERITPRAIMGVLVAMAGIALLFANS